MGRGGSNSQASSSAFHAVLGRGRHGSKPAPGNAGARFLKRALTERLAQSQHWTGTRRPDIGLTPPIFTVAAAEELLPDVPWQVCDRQRPMVQLTMTSIHEDDRYLLTDMLAALRLDPYPLPEQITFRSTPVGNRYQLTTVAQIPFRSQIYKDALKHWS